MKKTKTQKGITLIALIITIIILLILAVVAIGAVQNDGIIEYAKNARNQYQGAQTNEQTILGNYLEKLNENAGNSTSIGWVQEGTKVKKGTEELEVGDYVDYVSGAAVIPTGEYEYENKYDENGELVDQIEKEIMGIYEENGGKWKILGAENGKILLMSTTDVSQSNLCGSGEYATGARNIKSEDINRITGYNPRNVGVYDLKQTGEGTLYGQGKLYEYGSEITYTVRYNEELGYETAYYTTTNNLSGDSGDSFVDTRDFGDSTTITNSSYEYYPSTLTDQSTGSLVGISTDSKAYKMLFRNDNDSSYAAYSLESESINLMTEDGNYNRNYDGVFERNGYLFLLC